MISINVNSNNWKLLTTMKWTTYQKVRKKKKKRFPPQSRPITGTTKMKHSLKLWEVARRKTHYVQEVKGPLRYGGRLPPAASQNHIYKPIPTLSSDNNQRWLRIILLCVRSVFVFYRLHFIECVIKCSYLIKLLSNV